MAGLPHIVERIFGLELTARHEVRFDGLPNLIPIVTELGE
jgi:hypothetical protein